MRTRPIQINVEGLDTFNEFVQGSCLRFETKDLDALHRAFPNLRFTYTQRFGEDVYHVVIDLVHFTEVLLGEYSHHKFLLNYEKS